MSPLDNNGEFDWNRAFTRLSSEKTPAGAQLEESLLETYKIELPPMTHLKISPEQPQEIDDVSLNILKQCKSSPFSSYVPIAILGDGNCMYRALSMGLYGTQDHHQHIRMLTSIEMLKYREFYDAESEDFNNLFDDDQLVFGKYHDLIRDATELGSFSKMMHILAASAALHVAIQTYCPTLNFLIPSEHFTKTVYGRGVSRLQKADVILMRTTSSPNDPLLNHFVILLESEGPMSDELRDNHDDDMISQTDDSTEHRPNFAPTPQEVASCLINPEYLHTNGMVHTWIFSAFGEIIDNANDPDVMAKELWIDKVDIDKFPCLTFNLRMMALGWTEQNFTKCSGATV